MTQSWRDRASCQHHEPSWWDDYDEHNDDAIRICFEICPVRDECLTDALTLKETSTIRGGLTADERQMKRKHDERTKRGNSPDINPSIRGDDQVA